jgi:sec-independent protein translocase protein TatB
MFDIGGVELLIIAVVAIIVVGPKDLPGLLRRVGKMVTKARGMAGEFKSHFDDIADQEEFKEIRQGLDSVKDLSPTNQIKKAMSPFEEAGEGIKETFGGMDEALPSIAPEPKKTAGKKTAKKSTGKKAAPKSKKAKASSAKTKKTPKKAPKKAAVKTAAKKPSKVVEKAGA